MDFSVTLLDADSLARYLPDLEKIDEETIGEKWEPRHFQLELPSKWECSWMAMLEQKVIGFVIASLKPESIHVHRIAVHPTFRGQGIGVQLLRRVAECGLARNQSFLTLVVSENNRGAIRFYERLGFAMQSAACENRSLRISSARFLAETH